MSSRNSSSTTRSLSSTPSRDTVDRWTPVSTPRAATPQGSNNTDSGTASPLVFTPSSSTLVSFSPQSSGVFQFQGSPNGDAIRPSIERNFLFPRRSPVPARSLAPSPSSATAPSILLSAAPAGTATPSAREPSTGRDDISAGMQRIRLSSENPLDMRNMAAALPRAISSGANPQVLHDQTPNRQNGTPQRPAGTNRRSSSRANLIPHDVRDEEPPQDRFHDPAFQQAFRNAKAIVGSLAGVLGSSTLQLEPDSTIVQLTQTARRLADFQCPPTRVVGLVGDSGVGKSTLLNSLLDRQGLARASGMVAACTSVVTEYRYHELDTFSIEVEEFTHDDLSKHFTEMVTNYRHNHFHSTEIDNDQDRERWENLAKLARDTLSVMFRGQFTPDLLISGEPEDVVQTLLGWSRQRNSTAGRRVVNTLEDCSTQLMQLTSEEASPQGPAAWPYIKKISVFLNAHILSRGLVLVDLPGLRDLNSARRVITERYLRRCDEIFAVCAALRASSNESVMSIFQLARQAGVSNVGIICTKSDAILADKERRGWRGEQANRIQELLDDANTAERALDEMRGELELLRSYENDLSDAEQLEMNRLYGDIGRQTIEAESRQHALHRYLIEENNRLATAELRTAYGSELPANNLSVFCASNTMYWDNRNKTPAERYRPLLQLSGIIDIRKHCLSLVSESQLSIARRYIQDEIPNLISQLELWVQSGSGSADEELRGAVRAALDQLDRGLRQKFRARGSPLHAFGNLLASDFDENIYQRRDTNRWTRGAVNAGHRWDRWHHTTYAAFCRNDGIHSTGMVGYHNWNEEAIEAMVENLSGPWEAFTEVLRGRSGMVAAFINEALAEAVESRGHLPDEYYDSISPLHAALTSRQRLLETEVDDLCTIFERQVAELKVSALSGLTTGFFAQSMATAYAAANQICGTGSWARKKSVINSKLAEEQQFADLMRRFRTEFRALADQLQVDIRERVWESLDAVSGILDIIRSDNIAEESERDPEFRERVATEIEVAKAGMEEVRAVCVD